ncbi:MAG: fluoride efflux transporter CrcB [Flavobacteriaceae bacterium]|nr:fluoride efflux transporter CrcB [Flavobacteriaceae bacterium]|tara:strand:- start:22652 stop:23029 length:378 start_codon:yes stop_codon:yes gene_type:complete
MKNIFYIFLGGGFGSILRYAISKLFMADKSSFPWSTLIANFIGCFIIGIVLGWFINSNKQYSDLYVFLSIGFCGGLTTFSTFSVEGLAYLKNGDLLIFITYLLFSIIGSILLTALGYYIYQLGNS